MSRRVAALAIALGTAVFGYAGSSTPAPAPSAAVSSAELAALVRRAESAVIAFEDPKDRRQSKDAVASDRVWIEKLAAIVEAGPMAPQPHCFCISTLRIELYNSEGRLTSLTLHHDTKLRSSGAIAGDFEIGAERSQAILQLMVAEKPNARERVLQKLKEKRPRR